MAELAQAPRQGRPLRRLGCSLPFGSFSRYEPVFDALALAPEIVLDADHVTHPDPSLRSAAADLVRRRGAGTVHAPFMALFESPSAGPPEARIEEVLLATADWSAAVGASTCVLHTGWNAGSGETRTAWLRRMGPALARVTSRFVEVGVRPLVENCHESTPSELLATVAELHDETRCCLDPGHAIVVGTTPIDEWMAALGARLHQMHLHDNHGHRDEHLALGDGGGWDARGILTRVADQGIAVVPVLEPFDRATAERSLAALHAWGLR